MDALERDTLTPAHGRARISPSPPLVFTEPIVLCLSFARPSARRDPVSYEDLADEVV